jgi:uncharacterized protein YggE
MNMKRYSILIALVMLLALSACQALPAASTPAPNPNTPQRTVNVTGNGKVYVAPDVAYVFTGVHSQSENVGDALSQNNAKAQTIANTLKEMGIEDKDIQTSSFNIYPQQQYSPEGQLTGTIYMVDNTVNVTVRDLTKLGQILDAVVRAGANNINGINFDVLDKTAAISQARELAVQDAQRQAEELAAAAGVSLGELISMNAYTNTGPTPMYDAKGGAAVTAGEVPVSSGQLLISSDANLTYEIK